MSNSIKPDLEDDLEKLEKVHHVIDRLWKVPKTKDKKIGLGILLPILPFGSTISFFIKFQYILIANKNKFSKSQKQNIYKYLIVDWVLGFPPVLGSVLTFLYKGNKKTYELVKAELQQKLSVENFQEH